MSQSPSDTQKRRRRWVKYAAPALLCLVATIQRYNVHVNSLTMWKGGGFGMFATPSGNRHMSLRLRSGDGRQFRLHDRDMIRSPLHGEVADEIREIRKMPSTRRLNRFLSTMSSLDWGVFVPDATTNTSDDNSPSTGDELILPRHLFGDVATANSQWRRLQVTEIAIELWEYRIAADQSALELKQVKEFKVPGTAYESDNAASGILKYGDSIQNIDAS